MATYYWVGGTGTWDAAATANWAGTSGGAGGAGVPTAVDDVVFDAASDTGGPFTVTLGAGAVCRDFSTGGAGGALDQVMTLAGVSTDTWTVHGSLTFPAANLTRTFQNTVVFAAITTGHTITTNGVALLGAVEFNGVGGAWTLGSALNIQSGNFVLTNGSFNTGNYNLTAARINASNANARSLTLGSSTVTLSTATPIIFTNDTNLTFDAGTSQITCSVSTSSTFDAGTGKAFYNVSFTGVSSGTCTIIGANTFNNFSVASRTAVGIRVVELRANQVIGGTLTLGTANTAVRRMLVTSDSELVDRTLTVAVAAATTDVDFHNIVFAGAASPLTGTRLGDAGGVTGVTTATPKTVYWSLAAGGNWSATGWATSSGGTPNADNLPLAQDTAVFDDAGLNTSATVTIDQAYYLPGITCATRANAMTLTLANNVSIYGDFTLSSAVTFAMSGTRGMTFRRTGAVQTITSAGVVFPNILALNSRGGTLRLLDSVETNIVTGTAMILGTGVFDLNDNTFKCYGFDSQSDVSRSIAFGATGKVQLTGNNAAIWVFTSIANFSHTGVPRIELIYTGGTGTRTIRHGDVAGGSEANAVSFYVPSGTDFFATSATSHIKTLDLTGFAGVLSSRSRVIYGDLLLGASTTVAASTSVTEFAGTGVTQNITSAARTFDAPVQFSGVGTTYSFQDAFTQGATRAFTLVEGTVAFKESVTSTVGAFATSGSSQKFLNSGVAGVQATLSQASGTVSVSNLTIKDINATGGATWNAFTTNSNVDGGNNDGWDFSFQIGKYIYTRRKNKRVLP